MNTPTASVEVPESGSYQSTRFNALRYGVLSRYMVLPWENEAEYRTLLEAPVGPIRAYFVERVRYLTAAGTPVSYVECVPEH